MGARACAASQVESSRIAMHGRSAPPDPVAAAQPV